MSGRLQLDPPASFPAVSRDGRLVAAESNGTMRIFDLATKAEIERFDTSPDGEAMVKVSFSADSRWVALGSTRGAVTVWNVATGRRVAGPLRSGDAPTFGVFDPTTRERLFVNGRDGVVVWDLHDPARPVREVLTVALPAPTNPTEFRLAWPAADGRRIVVGSAGNDDGVPTVVLDAESGAEINRFNGVPGALSDDGRLVAIQAEQPGRSRRPGRRCRRRRLRRDRAACRRLRVPAGGHDVVRPLRNHARHHRLRRRRSGARVRLAHRT